jgi:ubiquinone/menaquinone biosynthesis C-methylase UbiE
MKDSIRNLGLMSHLDALRAIVGPVKGLRILDIGCGDGGLTRALADLGAHVTGYDPFITETARAEHGAGSYRLAPAPADRIPEPDQQADLVLFIFSLHHVPAAGLERALAEARRVLRPEGRCYVAEPVAGRRASIHPGIVPR